MKIIILARSILPYSTQRIIEELRNKNVEVCIYDPVLMRIFLSNSKRVIYYLDKKIGKPDGVIPRVGSSTLEYAISVLNQFELMGVPTLNSAMAIYNSKNKLLTSQILSQHNLPIAKTLSVASFTNVKQVVKMLGKPPYVIKILQGCQGNGVIYVDNKYSLISVLDTLSFLGEEVIIQHFIKESKKCDYRVLVLYGEIIGAIRRKANKDDFRSNVHKGGICARVDIPSQLKENAIKAVQILGLDFAGVDFLMTQEAPIIIEVNSTAGFKGMEEATGKNIARLLVEKFLERIKK
ncbi:MAG: RimK family alpha-L-glutamate ligase [Planctomycetota bacterium]